MISTIRYSPSAYGAKISFTPETSNALLKLLWNKF